MLFGWNFIAIQHDVDESLAAAGPHAHDLGYGGGTTIVTAAVYGHGMPGSITEAFSTHLPAVPTEAIVGTPIDFHQDGYLFLLSTSANVEQFKRNVALQQRHGVDVRWVTTDEARDISPGLDLTADVIKKLDATAKPATAK